MDGVGVKGDESVLSAGARKLVLRLVRPDEDHEPLLDLFERAHQETRFNYIPFSRDKARRLLRQVMAEDARHLVAVAEVGGKPEGFVYASVGEYFVGTDALIVTINVIYTSTDIRRSLLGGRIASRLMRAVEQWAKGIGAGEVLLHVTSGIAEDRAGRTAQRMGFAPIGRAYTAKMR
jgi:GNAT superfamily N-acetyltransferase